MVVLVGRWAIPPTGATVAALHSRNVRCPRGGARAGPDRAQHPVPDHHPGGGHRGRGAIAGLVYHRHRIDEQSAVTAAAFVRMVTAQGATVDTIECDGHTCAAIIGNQAYTVLVQKDAKGRQHFGVTGYVGP